MKAADAAIAKTYETARARPAYRGEFYPGPHRFDVEMQEAAFAWMVSSLHPAGDISRGALASGP